MAKAHLRYFTTDEQESQIAEILTDRAKKEQQKPKESRQYVLELLSNLATLGENNLDRVKNKGKAQVVSGSMYDLTIKEVEEAPAVESDEKWKPVNPDAKLRMITFNGTALINALKTCARLDNALQKKFVNKDKVAYECLEQFVTEGLTELIIGDYSKLRKSEFDEEIKEALSEKDEEKPEKPAEPPTQA